jgi:cell division protein FtsL
MISKGKNFKRDDSSESKFLPIILGILFFAIVGFLVVSNFRINKKRTELQGQIMGLEDQIKALQEKKAKLQAGISASESESFLEKEAREKLGLKKPGEEVVVVMPPKETAGGKTQENKGLWQKILEILHLRQ